MSEKPSTQPVSGASPRVVRLVRVRGLRAAHRAIAALACGGPPMEARDRAVLVPTTGAAWQLRRTLERLFLVDGWRPSASECERLGVAPPAAPGTLVLPDLVTRREWYQQLYLSAASPPPWLTDVEREVVLRAACDEVASAGLAAPFTLRPGLVGEILAFDDALRRQRRTVADLERLAVERFEPSADTDRGAARLLTQARFLVAALGAYRRRLADRGAIDEHDWTARLALGEIASRHRHVVITLADQAAEPSGLWPCDFDVLTRLPGLDRVDVVATEAVLDTGLHERLHERLPGIEECQAVTLDTGPPVLVVPGPEEERLYFVSRDREDEMAAAARRLTAGGQHPAEAGPHVRGEHDALDTAALVFQRPLPYLYVGRQVLDAEGVPYEAADELPLAAEPAASALDVVVTFVTSGYTRQATIALLRSRHLRIEADGRAPSAFDIAQLDEHAREAGYLGGRDRLESLAARLEEEGAAHSRAAAAARAARAAVLAASALAAAESHGLASALLDTIIAFLEAHERATPVAAPWAERERRARGAVRDVLAGLRDACLQHGDRETTLVELSSDIRHWIERHTFAPRTGAGGLQLVDELAARYGHFARVHLLGLVEGEWPRASSRNIFFPSVLLRDLGWPKDEDRQSAARAFFRDLLELASHEVSVSAFSLEDEALVRPSALVEELDNPTSAAFDRGSDNPPEGASHVRAGAGDWPALRASRGAADGPRFHGQAGPTHVARHSVTGIETYLDCPFKYFARKVLRLEEERPDEPGLDPLRRGRFVHAVFERFFDEWARDGHGAMTPGLVPLARTRFAALVEEMLGTLPPGDRAVERVRLLGSPAVAGFGERAFRLEADRPTPVLARRMEVEFDGEYDFAAGDRACRVRLRGVADRVDLLADGTLRVIDYKSGAAPPVKRAVQLPVYGLCAERALDGELGRSWRVGEAAYLAFGERRPYVPVIESADERDEVMHVTIGRFVEAVEGIARGEFPPRPAEWSLCASCAFAPVCRKDYVDGD